MQPNETLAAALQRARDISIKNDAHILLSSDIERSDRELLVRTGWLREIIKGWYMLVRPGVDNRESTVWYANFWDFIRIYLTHHYGENYCLSAENSIELHVGTTCVPKQVIVMASKGGGQPQNLLFDTSVYVYTSTESLPSERTKVMGINVMTLPYALCKSSPMFFKTNPSEATIALKSIRSHYDFVQTIIKNKFKRSAARIVGAYQSLGDVKTAEAIQKDLLENAIKVHAENPFIETNTLVSIPKVRSPHAARIFTMWQTYRDDVIKNFPTPRKLPSLEEYLQSLEDIYTQDAYNSLSIEGYVVDENLINKVKDQKWDPEAILEDSKERDALAARGYFEAFIEVKKSIKEIVRGADPGLLVEQDLPKWYRSLFYPASRAGIIPEDTLYGYRKWPVYIRNSRHVPLPKDALIDAMEALFACIKDENHPGVRMVLGHFIFVFIHPYMDGNGRTGRFLMNVMASSGGYPWTVIKVKNRQKYFKTLEAASVDRQIIPFTQFIAKEMTGNGPT